MDSHMEVSDFYHKSILCPSCSWMSYCGQRLTLNNRSLPSLCLAVSIAVMKHDEQEQHGEENFISFILPHPSPPLEDAGGRS